MPTTPRKRLVVGEVQHGAEREEEGEEALVVEAVGEGIESTWVKVWEKLGIRESLWVSWMKDLEREWPLLLSESPRLEGRKEEWRVCRDVFDVDFDLDLERDFGGDLVFKFARKSREKSRSLSTSSGTS